MLKFLYGYELRWPAWKFGVLKLSMLAFGILLGVMFSSVFHPWQPVLWGVFVVTAFLSAVWGFQAMADASHRQQME